MTIHAQTSVQVNAPAQAVFAFLSDVANHPAWADGVDEVHDLTENPVRLGSTWKQKSSIMGREVVGEAEVVIYDAPRQLTITATKPIPGKLSWTLAEAQGSTSVIFDIELEPEGLLKAAAPLLKGQIQKQMTADMEKLKSILEGEKE